MTARKTEYAGIVVCQLRVPAHPFRANKNSGSMVQELLRAGADVHYVQEIASGIERAATPSLDTKEKLAKLLLEKGADPNGRVAVPGRKATSTALARACRGGNLQAAKLLLEAGADLRLGTIDPLAEALDPLDNVGFVTAERAEKLLQLMRIAVRWPPILRASWLGLGDVVDALLKRGALLDDGLRTGGFTAHGLASDRGFGLIAQALYKVFATPGQTIRLRTPALCTATEDAIVQIKPMWGRDSRAVAGYLSLDGAAMIDRGTEVEVLEVTTNASRFQVLNSQKQCWSHRESVQKQVH